MGVNKKRWETKKKGEKNRKNRWKKIVRNFKKIIKILFFFELFWENVLKSLLRGPKTVRPKKCVFFEILPKNMVFVQTIHPSTIHPSIHQPSIHPSIQVGSRLGTRRAGVKGLSKFENFVKGAFLDFLSSFFFLPFLFFFLICWEVGNFSNGL